MRDEQIRIAALELAIKRNDKEFKLLAVAEFFENFIRSGIDTKDDRPKYKI